MEKKRALVIDDEQIVLDSVKKILESEGYAVFTASTGGSGISHALSEPFDVVLTDISMPRIDGYKVIRDIRQFNPTIPIMIITGYASVNSAVEAMKLGANHYIEKPFSPEQLMSAIAETIGKGGSHAAKNVDH